LTVFAGLIGKVEVVGQGADFGFEIGAEGENGSAELIFVKVGEEIGLVFKSVFGGFEEVVCVGGEGGFEIGSLLCILLVFFELAMEDVPHFDGIAKGRYAQSPPQAYVPDGKRGRKAARKRKAKR
jgi:hypothetical protein